MHVIGATVWVGGLITLSLLVPAIRKATDDRGVLQATARRFNVLSWTALGVQVTTGLWMVLLQFERYWTRTLILKLGVILLSAILAPQGQGYYYVVTARPAAKKERRIYRQTKGDVGL